MADGYGANWRCIVKEVRLPESLPGEGLLLPLVYRRLYLFIRSHCCRRRGASTKLIRERACCNIVSLPIQQPSSRSILLCHGPVPNEIAGPRSSWDASSTRQRSQSPEHSAVPTRPLRKGRTLTGPRRTHWGVLCNAKQSTRRSTPPPPPASTARPPHLRLCSRARVESAVTTPQNGA